MADSAAVTEDPPWLVAWRQGRTAPPAQPPAQPRSAPAQGKGGSDTHTGPVPPATPARGGGRWDTGFQEPAPWPFDRCKRREPVLDLDRNPPRVVRSVGWRICIRCRSPFWSVDVVGVRLCTSCKGAPDSPNP